MSSCDLLKVNVVSTNHLAHLEDPPFCNDLHILVNFGETCQSFQIEKVHDLRPNLWRKLNFLLLLCIPLNLNAIVQVHFTIVSFDTEQNCDFRRLW